MEDKEEIHSRRNATDREGPCAHSEHLLPANEEDAQGTFTYISGHVYMCVCVLWESVRDEKQAQNPNALPTCLLHTG